MAEVDTLEIINSCIDDFVNNVTKEKRLDDLVLAVFTETIILPLNYLNRYFKEQHKIIMKEIDKNREFLRQYQLQSKQRQR